MDPQPDKYPVKRCLGTVQRLHPSEQRWLQVTGSVKSSAGTYTAWIDVIEPSLLK